MKYWLDEKLTYAYLRLRGRVRRLVLLIAGAVPITVSIALICGLVGGLGIGLIGGSGLVHGAVIGVLVGTVLGATAGLAQMLLMWAEEPALTRPASTPTSSWRADRTLTVLRLLLALLAMSLGSALGAHLAAGIVDGW